MMSIDSDSAFSAMVAATCAVALFSAVLAWRQRFRVPAQQVLSYFFLAFTLSESDNIAAELILGMPQSLRDGLEYLSFTANFCIMPLFLIYVQELVAQPLTNRGRIALRCQFILPGVALLFSFVALGMPANTREAWYADTAASVSTPGLELLAYGFRTLTVLLLLQWSVYFVWIVITQTKHVTRLKQHFASTDGMELWWAAGLAVALGFYIVQSIAGEMLITIGDVDPIGPLFDSFLVLSIVVVVALWSLRPFPELDEATRAFNRAIEVPGGKYEKSALGNEQANRIANKLLYAMKEDRLYRDPNLTLSALAEKVGVSINYLSQTLNQVLGQSFFEFVNSWRIKEAIPLVESGEETVLAVAYEVGFNSRSSFYAAFKRETGMTPTAYRKAKTARDPLTVSRDPSPLASGNK